MTDDIKRRAERLHQLTDDEARGLSAVQRDEHARRTDAAHDVARTTLRNYECGMVAWKTIYDRCVVVGWSNVPRI